MNWWVAISFDRRDRNYANDLVTSVACLLEGYDKFL